MMLQSGGCKEHSFKGRVAPACKSTAFANEEYVAFLTKNGIRGLLVPLHHLASNGAAE